MKNVIVKFAAFLFLFIPIQLTAEVKYEYDSSGNIKYAYQVGGSSSSSSSSGSSSGSDSSSSSSSSGSSSGSGSSSSAGSSGSSSSSSSGDSSDSNSSSSGISAEQLAQIEAAKKRAEEAEVARNEAYEEYVPIKNNYEKVSKKLTNEYLNYNHVHDYWQQKEFAEKLDQEKAVYEVALNKLKETSKTMTEAYNEYSRICKEYNYTGDPVEVCSGNFQYEKQDFIAQDYLDKFTITRKLMNNNSTESFGKNWNCPLDSRIIRCNFDDNSEFITNMKSLLSDLKKIKTIITNYITKYKDFPDNRFETDLSYCVSQISDLENTIAFFEQRQSIYNSIVERNKYVCYGKYSNPDNYFGYEDSLIFYEADGTELFFKYCGNGCWKPYSKVLKQRLTLYNLNQSNAKSYNTNNDGGYLVEYANGNVKYFSKYGVLTKAIDRNKNVTVYNSINGKINSVQLKTGETVNITRNNGYITKISGPVSGEVNYYYENNKLVRIIDSNGNYDKYVYDTNNNIVEIDKSDSAKTYIKYEYNSILKKNVCVSVSAGGFSEKFIYYPNEKTVVHQIYDNQNSTFNNIEEIIKYNVLGNTVYKKDRNGQEVFLSYDDNSLLTTVKKNDTTNTIYYNENFYPTKIVNSSGYSSSCSYDKFGQKTNHSDADNFTNSMKYDDLGNLAAVYYCGNLVGTYSYYKNGLLKEQNVNGINTKYEYNSYGSVTKQIDNYGSKNIIKNWYYDVKNRPVKYIDEFGYITEIEYKGSEIIERYNKEKEIVRKYDSKNREYETTVKDLKYGNVYTRSYIFDSLSNDIKQIYINGVLIEENEYLKPNYIKQKKLWRYLDKNSQVKLQNQGIKIEYKYDKNDNISEKKCSVLTSVNDNGYESIRKSDVVNETNSVKISNTKTNVEKKDAYGQITKLVYDNNNRLTRKEYDNGMYENYTYSKGGRLISIIDSKNNKFSYNYKNDGSYDIVKSALSGIKETARYDKNNNLIYSKNALGNEIFYEYDINNNLVYEKNVNFIRQNVYDFAGRLISSVIKNNNVICSQFSVKYDDKNRSIEVIKNGNVFERTKYDVLNRIIEKTDANGTFKYKNDAMNNLIAKTDAEGNTTFFEYNVLGYIGYVKRPDGSEKTYQYSITGENINKIPVMNNKQVSVKDVFGSKTDITYDKTNNIKTVYNDKTGLQIYLNSSDNLQSTVTFENGTNYVTKFDVYGNPVYEKNQLGNTAEYKYDALNRVVKQRLFNGQENNFIYDDRNNRTTINLGASDKIIIERNAIGQITSLKNNYGNFTYNYDTSGLLKESYDVDSNIKTVYCYDNFGRCVSKKGDTFEIKYDYDNRGKISQISETNSAFYLKFKYDALGRQTKIEYSNGITVETKWNKDDRIESKISKNSIGEILNADFILYDEKGRISLIGDKNGNWQKVLYDERGRIVETWIPYSQEVKNHYINEAWECGSFVKDVDNKQVKYLSNEETEKLSQIIKNANQENRIKINTYANMWVDKIQYDLCGNVKSIKNPAGTIVYDYDKANRLIQKRSNETKNNGVKLKWSDNNVLTEIDSPFINIKMNYGVYNRPEEIVINNIVSQEKQSYSYTYDSLGRRLTETDISGKTKKYVYEGFSETLLQSIPLTEYFSGVSQLGINSEGSDINSDLMYRFIDASGYSEFKEDKSTTSVNSDLFSDYDEAANADVKMLPNDYSDYSDKIAEYKQLNVTTRLQKDERPVTFVNDGDNFLCNIYTDYTCLGNNDIECIITDFRNNVCKVCTQSGNCIAENIYDLWGNLLKEEKSSSYSYSKTNISEKTGIYCIYNLGIRDYIPSLKCFTSEDPFKDGANWFAFCSGDFVNYTDKNGGVIFPILCYELMTDYEVGEYEKNKPFLGQSTNEYLSKAGCYVCTNYNILKTMEAYGITVNEKIYKSLLDMNNDKDLFDDAKFKRSSYDKLYGENNHDYWTKKNTCTEFIEAELAKINADLDNTYFVQGIFELSSEQWSKIPNHMVGLNTTFDETGHMTDSSSITASSKNDNARMESDLNAYNLDKLKEIRYVKVNVPACKLSQ